MPESRPRSALDRALTALVLAVVGTTSAGVAWRGARALERAVEVRLGFPGALVSGQGQLALSCLALGAACAALVAPRVYRRRRRAVSLGGMALLLGVACTIGEERRIELSPERLELRTVRWYSLPFPHVRVTPEWVTVAPAPSLARHLRARGWLPPPRDDARWDFCMSVQFHVRGKRGRANSLASTLRHESSFWIAWSNAHPGEARELWPRVVDCAVAGDYSAANALLWEARRSALRR